MSISGLVPPFWGLQLSYHNPGGETTSSTVWPMHGYLPSAPTVSHHQDTHPAASHKMRASLLYGDAGSLTQAWPRGS